MPFEIGNQYAKMGGRSGYEIERKELKRMSRLLKRYLTLAEKIEAGKANANQKEAFDRLKGLMLKIIDKLHASKLDTKIDFENPIELNVNIKTAIDKIYGAEYKSG